MNHLEIARNTAFFTQNHSHVLVVITASLETPLLGHVRMPLTIQMKEVLDEKIVCLVVLITTIISPDSQRVFTAVDRLVNLILARISVNVTVYTEYLW